MRRRIVSITAAFLYLLGNPFPLHAHLDTSHALTYYPMHSGDKWIYEMPDTSAFFIREIHTTIQLPNKHTYFLITERIHPSSRGIDTIYLRVDTASLCIMQGVPHRSWESTYFLLYLLDYPDSTYGTPPTGDWLLQSISRRYDTSLSPFQDTATALVYNKTHSNHWLYTSHLFPQIGEISRVANKVAGHGYSSGPLVSAIINQVHFGHAPQLRPSFRKTPLTSSSTIFNLRPSSNQLLAEYIGPTPATIRVHDPMGRMLYTTRLSSSRPRFSFPLFSIATGPYLFSSKTPGFHTTQRVILVR